MYLPETTSGRPSRRDLALQPGSSEFLRRNPERCGASLSVRNDWDYFQVCPARQATTHRRGSRGPGWRKSSTNRSSSFYVLPFYGFLMGGLTIRLVLPLHPVPNLSLLLPLPCCESAVCSCKLNSFQRRGRLAHCQLSDHYYHHHHFFFPCTHQQQVSTLSGFVPFTLWQPSSFSALDTLRCVPGLVLQIWSLSFRFCGNPPALLGPYPLLYVP